MNRVISFPTLEDKIQQNYKVTMISSTLAQRSGENQQLVANEPVEFEK